MSLEQNIADLTNQTGLLLDLPDEIAQTATTQINAISDLHQSIMANGKPTFYIDQVNGDDAAEGTAADPLQSISKAVSLIAAGAYVNCVLMSDYHFNAELLVDNKKLHLISDSTIRHRITFDALAEGATPYRNVLAFLVQYGAHITIRGLTIVMPEASGGGLGSAIVNYKSALIRPGNSESTAGCVANIAFCDIEWPAAPCGPLVGFISDFTLVASANTETDQAMLGQWLLNETNVAGTDPLTLAYLKTNLALV